MMTKNLFMWSLPSKLLTKQHIPIGRMPLVIIFPLDDVVIAIFGGDGFEEATSRPEPCSADTQTADHLH